jgi:hypothetical protein
MNFIFIETHKNKIKKSGTSMKKAISCFLFVLTIAILVFHTYFGIVGATKVKARLVELEARGASGHEYLGVGADVVVLSLGLFSIIGVAFSLLSALIARCRAIRIASWILCPSFILPILVSGLVFAYA